MIRTNYDTIDELKREYRDFVNCRHEYDVIRTVDRLNTSRETERIEEISQGKYYVKGGFTVHGHSGRTYPGIWYGIETVEYDDEGEESCSVISAFMEWIDIDGRRWMLTKEEKKWI